MNKSNQRERPPLAGRCLEHPVVCDICERPRNRGDHQACSRVRQAKYRSLRETETVQHEAKANA